MQLVEWVLAKKILFAIRDWDGFQQVMRRGLSASEKNGK
jgi:hypothetical protein